MGYRSCILLLILLAALVTSQVNTTVDISASPFNFAPNGVVKIYTAPQGTTVTVTATVTGNSGQSPGGTVNFTDNGISFGVVPPTSSSPGAAAFEATFIGSVLGAHRLVATYSGDGNFAANFSQIAPTPVYQSLTPSPFIYTISNPGITYLGCLQKGDFSLRALPQHTYSDVTQGTQQGWNILTIELCAQWCVAFPFFGIDIGNECLCGTVNPLNNPIVTNASLSNCNTKCSGNSAQTMCGGFCYEIIYQQFNPGNYSVVGCFHESCTIPTANPKFSPNKNPSAQDPSLCVQACHDSGYQFAGYAGGSCTCGKTYGEEGYSFEEACNSPCSGPGVTTVMCGSGNSYSVYKLAADCLLRYVEFDGAQNYLLFSNGPFTNPLDFSISFWVKFLAPIKSSPGLDIIWGTGSATVLDKRVMIGVNHTGGVHILLVDFFQDALQIPLATLDNNYHHWVVTFQHDLRIRSLWMDGIQTGNDISRGVPKGLDGVTTLGTDPTLGTFFPNDFAHIDVADFRIYDRVLNEGEINTLTNIQEFDDPTTDPSLISWFQFKDVNTSLTVVDSNSIITGSLTGAPLPILGALTKGTGICPPVPPSTTVENFPANSTKAYFLGCFKDQNNPHDLPIDDWNPSSFLTRELCASDCAGYPYFGLQNAQTCWCGTGYGSYGSTPCTSLSSCPGDPTETCGQNNVNEVYSHFPLEQLSPSTYKGCYWDPIGDDLRSPFLLTANNNLMGVALCAAKCIAYTFYALQTTAGNPQCSCGNTFGHYGGSYNGSVFCNIPCLGNSSEICGGQNANSVYEHVPLLFRYLGCYITGVSLPFNGESLPYQTLELCAGRCHNYKYFGIGAGSICYCGNQLGLNGTSTNCSMLCTGNKTQICGGPKETVVYEYVPRNIAPEATVCLADYYTLDFVDPGNCTKNGTAVGFGPHNTCHQVCQKDAINITGSPIRTCVYNEVLNKSFWSVDNMLQCFRSLPQVCDRTKCPPLHRLPCVEEIYKGQCGNCYFPFTVGPVGPNLTTCKATPQGTPIKAQEVTFTLVLFDKDPFYVCDIPTVTIQAQVGMATYLGINVDRVIINSVNCSRDSGINPASTTSRLQTSKLREHMLSYFERPIESLFDASSDEAPEDVHVEKESKEDPYTQGFPSPSPRSSRRLLQGKTGNPPGGGGGISFTITVTILPSVNAHALAPRTCVQQLLTDLGQTNSAIYNNGITDDSNAPHQNLQPIIFTDVVYCYNNSWLPAEECPPSHAFPSITFFVSQINKKTIYGNSIILEIQVEFNTAQETTQQKNQIRNQFKNVKPTANGKIQIFDSTGLPYLNPPINVSSEGLLQIPIRPQSAGNVAYFAYFLGDNFFNSSYTPQANQTQVAVSKASIRINFMKSLRLRRTVHLNTILPLTARVVPLHPVQKAPTGQLRWRVDNTVILADSTVPINATGYATIKPKFNHLGNFNLTAEYLGDANFQTNVSHKWLLVIVVP